MKKPKSATTPKKLRRFSYRGLTQSLQFSKQMSKLFINLFASCCCHTVRRPQSTKNYKLKYNSISGKVLRVASSPQLPVRHPRQPRLSSLVCWRETKLTLLLNSERTSEITPRGLVKQSCYVLFRTSSGTFEAKHNYSKRSTGSRAHDARILMEDQVPGVSSKLLT